ncbi:hypothetical protein K435DRAFT_794885 [Dendrothele bispora CBS 962.96]|uniref:Mannosyltransferase n=1 Tax=Dendrothele bispora (strain CBS 962.96) TaxID=1314807 RepID=A0A4S8MAG6_DENBC|nr:hypothetical protein K435DRAFT_794885 [Dendrothele bispora CBS 962.96]
MSLLFALATLQVALSVPTNMLPIIVVTAQGLDGVNQKLFEHLFLASLMTYIFSKCVIIWQPKKWIPLLLTLISIGNNMFAIVSIITHAKYMSGTWSPGSLDTFEFLSKIGGNHYGNDWFDCYSWKLVEFGTFIINTPRYLELDGEDHQRYRLPSTMVILRAGMGVTSTDRVVHTVNNFKRSGHDIEMPLQSGDLELSWYVGTGSSEDSDSRVIARDQELE